MRLGDDITSVSFSQLWGHGNPGLHSPIINAPYLNKQLKQFLLEIRETQETDTL